MLLMTLEYYKEYRTLECIEHVIGRVKNFKIVAEKYRNHLKRFSLRFNLVCAIVNFQNHLR